MRSFAYILALLGAATAAPAVRYEVKSSDVVSLTQETFYDFMEQHELVLANFYAPWCGHSRALVRKFEAAATELKNDNIPLVKVDCTREETLCSDYGIRAYPTLKVFRGPESPEPYTGSRQAQSYVFTGIKSTHHANMRSIISYMLDESIATEAESRPGLFVQS